MMRAGIVDVLRQVLEGHGELVFAYLHGSAVWSDQPNDIDVAVYLQPTVYSRLARSGELTLGFAIPLEMELRDLLGQAADVQVLNAAPLPFRYRVISSGLLLVDRDPNARAEFESLARVEYFDFRPKRQAYLQEASG